MLELVRWCDLDSGATAATSGGVSTLAPASSNVECVRGETAGESANLADDLLDHVLKCAGGGREPVGRAGRLERKSCK